jgi:hypothetical protein
MHDVYALISEDFQRLVQDGVTYKHPHNGTLCHVNVKLKVLGGDYRAIQDMLALPGAPVAKFACFKCWLDGIRIPFKYAYGQFHRYLSTAAEWLPFRRVVASMNSAYLWKWERAVPGSAAGGTGGKVKDVDNTTVARFASDEHSHKVPPAVRTRADLIARLQVWCKHACRL